MLTHEERLYALERSLTAVNGAISGINHNETILLGMASKQEEIIREVNARLADLKEHQEEIIREVNTRLGEVDTRIAALNEHLVTFEQSVNSRFDTQDKRFDEHTALLTQILARLSEKP